MLRECVWAVLLTILVCAFIAGGCARNRVRAAAPVTVPPQAPAPIANPETIQSPASIPAPSTPAPNSPAPSTPPPGLTPKPDALKKPPSSLPPASPDESRPATPQISPQISASDEAHLAAETNRYVADAQTNLHRAAGRTLNPAQQDMVDKIHGFLSQAQDAIHTADWSRAKNLSQKAYLLSLELVKTL